MYSVLFVVVIAILYIALVMLHQGVQRRKVLVVNFYYYYFFLGGGGRVVAIADIVQDVEAMHGLC